MDLGCLRCFRMCFRQRQRSGARAAGVGLQVAVRVQSGRAWVAWARESVAATGLLQLRLLTSKKLTPSLALHASNFEGLCKPKP